MARFTALLSSLAVFATAVQLPAQPGLQTGLDEVHALVETTSGMVTILKDVNGQEQRLTFYWKSYLSAALGAHRQQTTTK